MDYLQRILWHEGMFLTPNQFQQWDRVVDWQIRFTARLLHPFPQGVAHLLIDREALSTETFALREASGILPDGTPFSLPEADQVPQTRPFQEHFTAQTDRLAVYLTLPAQRPGQPTFAEPSRPSPTPVRFMRKTVTVRDDIHGGTERDLQVAVKSLRIRFAGEDLEGLVALKICEIIRAPSGGFAIAEDYVPMCLGLGASPLLLQILRRVIDILCGRATDLANQRRQRTQGLVEFSVSESANYLLLHTINAAIPVLMHLLAHPHTHPVQLHNELARLGGALHTFASSGHPKDFPPYRHDNLAGTFIAIEALLRTLLETRITARYVALPVTRSPNGIFAARLPDAVIEGHRIYLSLASSAPNEKIVQQTGVRAKIAATTRVPQLIAQALKGLGLTYLPVPPGEISTQPGYSYFELQRSGDDWDMVAETRTLAIFLPPDFTDLKLEFMAVKE